MPYVPVKITDPSELLTELKALRTAVYEEGQVTYARWKPFIKRERFKMSAENLAYYLAFRSRDLRDLQAALPLWGLSSLGRAEARVLQNLDAVIATLSAVIGAPAETRPPLEVFVQGPAALMANAEELFGVRPDNRRVRIMVTMPDYAADDPAFVKDLVERGMNYARINCAHDDPGAWTKMIANIRKASAETGRGCGIHMDLGGPKVRTGAINRLHGEKRAYKGDGILLTRGPVDTIDDQTINFQTITSEPAVIEQAQVGQEVWIDDGEIGTVIESKMDDALVLRVTDVSTKGSKLKAEKGINFPDTELKLSPLTPKDIEDLDYVVEHADAIGYSFVQTPEDVDMLHEAIKSRVETTDRLYELAVVAKIETKLAVRNLPELIIRSAGQQPFGVMIARGDLAVEIGYQRMAEMQEQIMWICEAAHVPVIWATQVFESFAKQGIPSRAEVTDAAMGERAECVMLNKGPFIHEVVTTLDDVLSRMQAHQIKKTPQLRELRSWQ